MRYEVTIVYKNNSIKKVFCNAETKEEVDKYIKSNYNSIQYSPFPLKTFLYQELF